MGRCLFSPVTATAIIAPAQSKVIKANVPTRAVAPQPVSKLLKTTKISAKTVMVWQWGYLIHLLVLCICYKCGCCLKIR